MKILFSLGMLSLAFLLTSCGTKTVPVARLGASEQSLLTAINQYRKELGKSALEPSADLTDLAHKDALRRVTTGGGYVDHRQETGYERMLTLAGKVQGGEDYGSRLLEHWKKNPVQRAWLEGNYAGVGVGTAAATSGAETGVVLLGGFSGGI
ncbi:CAP domain-containing protein [Roseibacillus persicicus]|nr:CAP domain-containing protein [Roseibacillus persicicus]